jgi:transcriptional regulator with XRE-family HTH domain
MLMSTTILEQWDTFARTIKDGRMAHGWPMRRCARMTGISLGYLGLLETARCAPPSDAILLRMADLLEIHPSTLFAMAGRLPPDILAEFWQHPAISPVLSTIPGMTLADAPDLLSSGARVPASVHPCLD